jgi:hypothetical protein
LVGAFLVGAFLPTAFFAATAFLPGDFRAMAAFFAVLRDLAGADFFAVMPQRGWGVGIVPHREAMADGRWQTADGWVPGTGCRMPDATPDT